MRKKELQDHEKKIVLNVILLKISRNCTETPLMWSPTGYENLIWPH